MPEKVKPKGGDESTLAFRRTIMEVRAVQKLRAVVPLALWAWVIWHLHDEWTLNPQYNYGWLVPIAAAVAFYLRWRDRPAPSNPRLVSPAAFAQCFCLLALLPVRVVEIANPDWRLLGWLLAIVAIGVSFLEIYKNGGATWVKHFAFPILFPLAGVPWPVHLENIVVQSLSRAVAAGAVEIAGWFGVGALRLGNIIELHNGALGVDEACSGVRTLQAGLMLALILGELFRLAGGRRWLLIFAGCVWVFLCNIARATLLVLISAKSGPAGLACWHDLVGTALLVIGIGGIFVLAWRWRGPTSEARTFPSRPLRSRSGRAAAVAWLLFVFGAAEFWYRLHERDRFERAPWHAQWPVEDPDFSVAPISTATKTILRFDFATSAQWQHPPGVDWWGFYARWRPSRTALQLVRSHTPEICLPAAGRVFIAQHEPASVGELKFSSYEFAQADRPLFVFVAIQDDRATRESESSRVGTWNTRGRLLAAWRGQRNLGQRLIELAIFGLDDFASARTALLDSVPALVAEESAR